jgi:hypothetical protein
MASRVSILVLLLSCVVRSRALISIPDTCTADLVSFDGTTKLTLQRACAVCSSRDCVWFDDPIATTETLGNHYIDGDLSNEIATFDDYLGSTTFDYNGGNPVFVPTNYSVSKSVGSVNLADAGLNNGCCQFTTTCMSKAACIPLPPPPPSPPPPPTPPGPCLGKRNVVEGDETSETDSTVSTDDVYIQGCVEHSGAAHAARTRWPELAAAGLCAWRPATRAL